MRSQFSENPISSRPMYNVITNYRFPLFFQKKGNFLTDDEKEREREKKKDKEKSGARTKGHIVSSVGE